MVMILDCTLRDGGYINEFTFGNPVMVDIVDKLSRASVDIIECGFLQTGAVNPEQSLFGKVQDIKNIIKNKNPSTMYVAMIQYGKIGIEEIEQYTGESVDGIRLTFHEHEIDDAFVLGKQLEEKNYKVFMQPVGTTGYTDEALVELIDRVNQLRPYAFYMVDTLGIMYKKDIRHMFSLLDNHLDKGIKIGFHSHNNLQLSFANAQELLEIKTDRDLIIDSSVFGMGRGAGNLNTELIAKYINDNICPRYNNTQIMEILDLYIKPLRMQYQWGYDAPYYISAIAGCHPNYASFLMQKQTLRVQDIYNILHKLDIEERALFNREYIQQQYLSFMDKHVDDTVALAAIQKQIAGKTVILVAPGKSVKRNQTIEKVSKLAEDNQNTVLSINFLPAEFAVDMVFVSNKKRFASMNAEDKKVIVTSNILTTSSDSVWVVDYLSYIIEDATVVDNAGLMCLNLLQKLGVQHVVLVGFDGFKTTSETFADRSMYIDMEEAQRCHMNKAIARKLIQLRSQMDITFLTDSIYESWIKRIMS